MSADDVFFWANWILVGALLVGVAATYAVVVSGNVRDKALKHELAAQGTATAQANERAANLEREAAEARLETERLKTKIAPRTLIQAQQNELTAKLAGLPPQRGAIAASPSTPESEMFVRTLAAPLVAAGWKMDILPGTPTATVLFPTGVVIQYAIDPRAAFHENGPEAEAANRLASALGGYGIDATAVPGLMAPPTNIKITVSQK